MMEDKVENTFFFQINGQIYDAEVCHCVYPASKTFLNSFYTLGKHYTAIVWPLFMSTLPILLPTITMNGGYGEITSGLCECILHSMCHLLFHIFCFEAMKVSWLKKPKRWFPLKNVWCFASTSGTYVLKMLRFIISFTFKLTTGVWRPNIGHATISYVALSNKSLKYHTALLKNSIYV